jgi:hypothetical protein
MLDSIIKKTRDFFLKINSYLLSFETMIIMGFHAETFKNGHLWVGAFG